VFKQLDTFKLRWFTPAAEVPLCGHATLASAATLFTGGQHQVSTGTQAAMES
jgi:predicted PhzF superfamily epimerase YddE/YHI9